MYPASLAIFILFTRGTAQKDCQKSMKRSLHRRKEQPCALNLLGNTYLKLPNKWKWLINWATVPGSFRHASSLGILPLRKCIFLDGRASSSVLLSGTQTRYLNYIVLCSLFKPNQRNQKAPDGLVMWLLVNIFPLCKPIVYLCISLLCMVFLRALYIVSRDCKHLGCLKLLNLSAAKERTQKLQGHCIS